MADNTFERNNLYRDFDLSFTRHPLTNDVSVKNDVAAISQSIRTLVQTNFYERRFHPEIGSRARALLFENANPITINNIRQQIHEVIFNYEPRAIVRDIIVENNIERNAYSIRVSFSTNNLDDTTDLTMTLERLR